MKPIIVLDSGPLGLLFQRTSIKAADDCRRWIRQHIASGVRIIVPDIVNYELRRELLRLGKSSALALLAEFNGEVPGRFLPITSAALNFAAELWAQARRQGNPTADPHALDVDVILAAQLLVGGFDPADFVVATTNLDHIARFVPAAMWEAV